MTKSCKKVRSRIADEARGGVERQGANGAQPQACAQSDRERPTSKVRSRIADEARGGVKQGEPGLAGPRRGHQGQTGAPCDRERPAEKVRLPANTEPQRAEARGGVKQDSRSALLQAALECFSSRGFDGASIRDIAQKAGLNSSLISHHFGSKEGLYIELFRHICRQKDAGLDAQDDVWPAPQDRAQAIQQLREQIRRLYQSFNTLPQSAHPSHFMEKILMAQELREPRPQVLAILRERMLPWFTRTGECLRLLKPEMREAQRAFLAITIMGQVMGHHMMRGFSQACLNTAPLPVEAAVDLLTEFNLKGLGGNKC